MRQIWKEGKVPIEWKKSIIVPLYKRGDQEEVGNYRGISLLCTAYKVCRSIEDEVRKSYRREEPGT